MIIKKALAQDINDKINLHWGSSGIEIETGITTFISRVQFRKSLEHMMALGDSCHEHEECLDIIHEAVRFSVSGKEGISIFCKKEIINGSFSILEKKSLEKIDILEYGCRIRISKETPLQHAEYPVLADKHYRLKKRFSVQFGTNYRIDYTIVRAGTGRRFDQVKFKPDVYEVEIEYIGSGSPPVLKNLFDYTEEVLKTLRDEVHLVRTKEKGSVIPEYYAVVASHIQAFGTLDKLMEHNPRGLFIGPQPVTLLMDNVAKTGKPSLHQNYMVTEKADGQRYLLFVDKAGLIYLINARMEIKNTNLEVGVEYAGSIFDCEVTHIFNGNIWILLFDAYFQSGNAVYTKNLKERIEIAKAFANLPMKGLQNNKFEAIKCKTFYEDPFVNSKTILSKNKEFLYHTDGTPSDWVGPFKSNSSYGSKSPFALVSYNNKILF